MAKFNNAKLQLFLNQPNIYMVGGRKISVPFMFL